MAWPSPLAIIDFEASSLEHDGYPIEVGLAIVERKDRPVRTWSSLIRPTTSWRLARHWSKKSERVHGIAREELGEGQSPRAVMTQLNELLAPMGRAYCDGGDYDRAWLQTLSDAAGVKPAFELCDFQDLFAAHPDGRDAIRDRLNQSPAPHRAGPDAARLMHAVVAVFRAAEPSGEG